MKPSRPCRRLLVALGAVQALAAGAQELAAAGAPQYVFNTNFLRGDNSAIEIGELLSSGVLPGTYQVAVVLNGSLRLRRDIVFAKNARSARVEACIDLALLEALRIDVAALVKARALDPGDRSKCLDLPLLMDKASQSYEPGRFRLSLSIPQVFLLPQSESYVDPALWDYGIDAAFSNYSINTSSTRVRSASSLAGSRTTVASTFASGINVLGWRYRNTSSLTAGSGQRRQFSSFTNYVEHDVPALKAQLRMGDVFATSRLLDPVGIRGVQLSDELAMQPGKQSMPRPVVRGVADTNATVEVRQLNFLIYTAKVPPGAFEMADINPAGSAGDLEVRVVEADGRVKTSIQPWGTNNYMVRKGFFTYDAAIGRYRPPAASSAPTDTLPGFPDPAGNRTRSSGDIDLLSFDSTYGLAEKLSLLGGVQLAQGYRAIALGVGTDTPIGPVALDVQQSSSTVLDKTHSGSSLRVSYAKLLNDYGTSFAVASQRYSTAGFRSFTTHAQSVGASHDPGALPGSTPKLSTSISVSQSLRESGWGSFYLSISDNRPWDDSGRSTSVSAGYSNRWKNLSYSVALGQARNLGARGVDAANNTTLSFSVSIPLGSTSRPVAVSASMARGSDGRWSETASLGSSLDLLGSPASYSVYGSGQGGNFNSMGASLSGRTPFAGYSLAASHGSRSANYGGSLNGGVLLHSGGVNFSNTLNETMILADLDGQAGVQVNQLSQTGRNGYAVIPNAMPYQLNQVLVGKNLPADVDLVEGGDSTAVPRRGAISRVRFEVRSGRRIEFQVFRPDGRKAPFGAVLRDEKGNRLGITDPSGKSLVLLLQDAGTVKVAWGEESCLARYALGEKDARLYYEKVALSCPRAYKEARE